MLATVKRRVLNYREAQSIRRHKTRMERSLAEKYTSYWERCRTVSPAAPTTADPEITRAVRDFIHKGFTSFWTLENQRLAEAMFQKLREDEQRDPHVWAPNPEYNSAKYNRELYQRFEELERLFQGSLGAFLTGVYGSPFKIFYGILYRSEHLTDQATGSQLWHDDGGPGTCINVMFCLSDVKAANGAMECLPWEDSLAIYLKDVMENVVDCRLEALRAGGRTLTREEARAVRCQYYLEEIERAHRGKVEQPTGHSGMVLPFRNNIIHKGGYPQPGHTRYVCVFHCYPSDKPTPYERYRTVGIPKLGSLPKDPAGDF